MFNGETLLNIMGLASIVIAIALVMLVIYKQEKIKQLYSAVNRLKKSLDEMDEQAKLIVRTDIELNKTQEELDKKITGLYTLQRLSRAISTTLEEEEIFKMIGPAHIEDLGFEKACAFLWSEREKKFLLRLAINYSEDEAAAIYSNIESNKEFYNDFIRREKTLSSLFFLHDEAFLNKMRSAFKAASFVISPISTREGKKGFLSVATESPDTTITEGDEELITILANQIGQALDNAHLFEKTWLAQQELEKKVEERTRQLTLALEEVKKMNKRKSDFISSVSHELRTPLTSIKGYAAILIAEKLGALPPAVKERLEKVNRHTDELVHMVNDLLDIARIESGRVTMKVEGQDLKEIIGSVSDLISIQCKNKNITLTADVPQDIPAVLADKSQLERVFINLLGNAVKFTPQNGKITMKAEQKNGFVQVDISDTGIGIPPESVPLIFDEFYRVDNPVNQQVKGSGLGLSLVKQIVEAHRGRIWVESQPSKGSTFSFTLPAK